MLAVYKKEFKSFFGGLLGYIYLAANLFFSAWYFRYYQMICGYPYISYVFNGILMIFLFSLPLLTMRSFSEEMRHKTDQLLFTSPVPVWKIILGKYFAILTVFAIPVTVISFYPLVLRIFGEVPLKENYLSVFGFFLFGAACLAIGIFISSMTDNQLIAAVFTFFVLLLGMMLKSICEMISTTGNIFTTVLLAFDLAGPFDDFQYGILSMASVIYYISVVIISLLLTGFVIRKRRWSFSSKGFLKSFSSVFSLVFAIIVIIAFNVFIDLMPDSFLYKDLTYNSIYSISDITKHELDGLSTDVTIYYIVDTSNIDDTIEHTLVNIADYSDKINLVYVSPTDNPYFYSTYLEEAPVQNSIIVTSGDNFKFISYYDCYDIEYEYEYSFESGEYVATDYEVVGYDGEGRILSAIDYIDVKDFPKIYCINGHDELEIEDSLADRLAKANYVIENITLLNVDAIPDDAAAIFILGPLSEFSDDDVRKVKEYLEKGGNAIVTVAYTDSDELTNYYSILDAYNIEVHPGLVIEQGTSFYNSQPYYLLPDIVECDLTEGVYSYLRNKYVYMPYSKGFMINQNYADAVASSFLNTTENAYCLTDVSGETDSSEYDTAMYSLGVYAEKSYPECSSKIVAFASDYFLYQDIDSAVSGDNYDVFMNCVTKITGTNDKSIVPVKFYSYSNILINETASGIISTILIILVPAAIMIVGLLVWVQRRKY